MKTAIVAWHGLGDIVTLTPVLRKYKEVTNEDLYLLHLERLPVEDLLKKCPYIEGFHKTKDVWNDFSDIDIGRKEVMKQAQEYADKFGYDKIVEITMSPSLGIAHKIHRAAYELGIKVDDYRTEIFPKITKKVKERADKFLEKAQEPYIFVHLKTGNPPKDISKELVMQVLGSVSLFQVIEYGSRDIPSHYLPIGDIPLEMEILSRCSQVICADSFIMHAACALGIPTKAIFVHTPVEWVIPLYETPLDVYIKM